MPPAIVESGPNTDMVVREGSNVTLMCRAKGYPEPYVRQFVLHPSDLQELNETNPLFYRSCGDEKMEMK